ncbi:Adenylate kinase 7, partial [Quaeritorhiza haematococci]
MKVFISHVDTPLGHNLSRVFVSSSGRKNSDEGEDAPPEQEEGSPEDSDQAQKQNYSVVGTLSPAESRPVTTSFTSQNGTTTTTTTMVDLRLPDFRPPFPGPMLYTGDKKRDAGRKEAIEKYAVSGQKPRWVSEIVQNQDKEQFKNALLASDVIVFDLLSSLDDATWAIEVLNEAAETFTTPKTFIAISTVMTWAKTKVDPDDPDAYLTEEDYRRRKPHVNFKAHLAVEKNVIKLGKKSSIRAYVVAAGLLYHSADCIFHYLFKTAWHNQDLVCYGEGSNTLPTIHVDDLVNIVIECAESLPETKYILALDDSKHTLHEITKAISEALGNGKVRKLPKEHVLLNRDFTQAFCDMILLNLRVEPGHIKDMQLEWKYEAGIIDNLTQIIQDYKDARGLTALKMVLHGPPAVGKSTYAAKIAAHYDIHLIDAENVVQDAMSKLERRVAKYLNKPPTEPDEDIDADRELLEEIKEAMNNNGGKIPDEH